MTSKVPKLVKNSLVNAYLLRCIGLVLAYIVLILILPANDTSQATYRLSASQYRILTLIVVAPYLGIWFIALISFAKFKQYYLTLSNTSSNKREVEAFCSVCKGIGWFAWGLPATALISLICNGIANWHSGFNSMSVIIQGYSSLIIAVGAFYRLSQGGRQLVQITKQYFSNTAYYWGVLGRITVAVLFCYFVFRHLDLTELGSTANIYKLPVWLVISTVVVPYLFAWFTGVLAAYAILIYGLSLDGVIYRPPFRLLIGGILTIILGGVVTQFIRSVLPTAGHISIGWMLLALYVIFFITANGYAMIGIAADRLRKIEEV